MTKIVNAFHPDYVKTYMPGFLTDIRVESRQTKAGQTLSKYVDKTREKKPSHGTLFGISDKLVSTTAPAHMHRYKLKQVSTSVTEFHIYTKAGMPKKTQSQIMSEVVAKKRQESKSWGTVLHNSKNIPKNIPKDV